MTFLDVLVGSLCAAARFNPAIEVAPAAVLWPDLEAAWLPCIGDVSRCIPLLRLGVYQEGNRSGPATWIRCALATAEQRESVDPPVVYLPNLSSNALLTPDEQSHETRLLAELAFRSALWRESKVHDWTPEAFFASKDGLGVGLKDDEATRRALRGALPRLLPMTISELQERAPWRAADFEALTPPLDSLILLGESAQLEFKSTARWNTKAGKQDPEMEAVIVETIAAFLNSHGGTLLIGIGDDGTVRGIGEDLKLWPEPKRNTDQYELWLRELLAKSYGKHFGQFTDVTFHLQDGKIVCQVDVRPAPEPTYVKDKASAHEWLYIRDGNRSVPLALSSAVPYIRQRWKW